MRYFRRVVREKRGTSNEPVRGMVERFTENRKLLWKEVMRYRNDRGKKFESAKEKNSSLLMNTK